MLSSFCKKKLLVVWNRTTYTWNWFLTINEERKNSFLYNLTLVDVNENKWKENTYSLKSLLGYITSPHETTLLNDSVIENHTFLTKFFTIKSCRLYDRKFVLKSITFCNTEYHEIKIFISLKLLLRHITSPYETT